MFFFFSFFRLWATRTGDVLDAGGDSARGHLLVSEGAIVAPEAKLSWSPSWSLHQAMVFEISQQSSGYVDFG